LSGGKTHRASRVVAALCGVLIGLAAAAAPARAGDVSSAELRTALQSLGFLASLQNRAAVVIGVVYYGADPGSKAQAIKTAADLSKLA